MKLVRELYQDGKLVSRHEDDLEPGKTVVRAEHTFDIRANGTKTELRSVVTFLPPVPIPKDEA